MGGKMYIEKSDYPACVRRFPRAVLAALLPFASVFAQVPNPTQKDLKVANDGSQPITVFHVEVVSRTMKAINYHHRQGSTNVDFRGTALEPDAKGEANVDSKTGATKVNAKFSHLEPAARFGPEFVTYVLWAITPEGRANNLGEVFLNGSNSSIQTSTDLQAFGLMVTAEPYFAVSQPSDVVVMENFVRQDTTGTIEQVDAKFELLQRGIYTRNMSSAVVEKMKLNKNLPLDLQEARNAVLIARNIGAENYAADTMLKANQELQNAEGFLIGKGDKKMLQTVARQATQMAEDARIITIRKIQDAEKAAALQRELDATKEAENQTRQRASADASRMEADKLRLQADRLRTQAEADRAAAEAASRKAESDRATADAARNAALEEQKKLAAETASARAATDEANRLREQAEKEKAALREQIRAQLNLVLETRDSARGLIVNMSDVLFDTAKYTLRAGTREKLAKVSGILLAHPGLILAVEGHTDSIGGDEYNQTLSEHRAQAVRDYLVTQGIQPDTVTSQGFGKTMPVTTNDTAAGRQQNRRVEMVVSGDPIAKKLMSDSNIK
jgi:outer membrane protein OmpA-like peptidoglycan-associated protein